MLLVILLCLYLEDPGAYAVDKPHARLGRIMPIHRWLRASRLWAVLSSDPYVHPKSLYRCPLLILADVSRPFLWEIGSSRSDRLVPNIGTRFSGRRRTGNLCSYTRGWTRRSGSEDVSRSGLRGRGLWRRAKLVLRVDVRRGRGCAARSRRQVDGLFEGRRAIVCRRMPRAHIDDDFDAG